MKVVLFCGGLGMRLREFSDRIPKPMVPLRNRPILWHIMRYYAHYGHKDFILCLGYKGDAIKDYFLNYSECVSNDFVLSEGGRRVEPLRRDIDDWRITFVDTGLSSNIGERLRAVRPFLEGEEMFLATYGDGLTDCPLPAVIERARKRNAVATLLAVRPNNSFHVAALGREDMVAAIHDMRGADLWINGGFFVLRSQVFDHMRPGEELVVEPFQRLVEKRLLAAHPHEGFWRGVDTLKDLQDLEAYIARGDGPWELWRKPEAAAAQPEPIELRAPRPLHEIRVGAGGGGAIPVHMPEAPER